MSLTISQQQGQYFQRLIDVYYAQLGASRTTSTFNLYRRTASGLPANDLGVPDDPYTLTYNDQPCTVVGIKQEREGAFEIVSEGQVQHPILEVHCTLTDVRAGDNLILALDGKPYHVDRATIMGDVTYLLLDHGNAQIQV